MVKRRVLFVALLLLAGAILNVAVAWGCAIWISAYEHGKPVQGWIPDATLPDERQHWWVMHWDAFGATRVLTMARQRDAQGAVKEDYQFPAWSGLSTMLTRRQPGPYSKENPPRSFVADARGWPLRALMCRWDYGNPRVAQPAGLLEGGIELSPYRVTRSGGLDLVRALPWFIVWPGFIGNTLMYAGALWLVWVGAAATRRSLRARRNLCPACGYPIGASSVCTECGAAVTPLHAD